MNGMYVLRIVVRLAFAAAPVFASETVLAQACVEFARIGIYDVRSSQSETSRARAFRNWYCQSGSDTSSSNSSFGLSAIMPTDSMPITLGFEKSDSGRREMKNEVCSENFESDQNFTKLTQYVKTINPAVVSAFQACITQSGFHVWLEQAAHPKRFFVRARFVASGKTTKVERVVIRAPSTVQCDLQSISEVGASTVERLCTRTRAAVDITVNADENPIRDTPLSLSALVEPRPVVRKLADAFVRDRSSNVTTATAAGYPDYGQNTLFTKQPPKYPTKAVYDIYFPKGGNYDLHVQYQIHVERQVDVTFNDDKVGSFGAITTGDDWSYVATINATPGTNTLSFWRSGDMPHVKAIKFLPSQ